MADGRDEGIAIFPGGAILHRRVGQARIAAKLARPVMMHHGQRVRHVGGDVSGSKFPDKMVANFDNGPGPADVFGSDSVPSFHPTKEEEIEKESMSFDCSVASDVE